MAENKYAEVEVSTWIETDFEGMLMCSSGITVCKFFKYYLGNEEAECLLTGHSIIIRDVSCVEAGNLCPFNK